MTIYFYNPLPKIGLGYAHQRIYDYLKKHGGALSSELYKLSGKKSNPLKYLLEKGIVIKNTMGIYELRKEVSYYKFDESAGLEFTWEELEELEKHRKPPVRYSCNIENVPSEIKAELKKNGHCVYPKPKGDLFPDFKEK
jgi:hypothetical protein